MGMAWNYLQQFLPGKGQGVEFRRAEQARNKAVRGEPPPPPAWVRLIRLQASPPGAGGKSLS